MTTPILTTHILIVEDEPKLADLLAKYLQREDYRSDHLADGTQVMPWLATHATDLILLDLNLPGRDGLALCRDIRQREANQAGATPIIMTTARVDEIDRLLGLELGADDYVCKPYSPREVVARIKAVLRRTRPASGVASPAPALASLQFDDERLLATVKGVALDLTQVEYQLFKLLADKPGRIYSRDQLMDRIYPDQRIVSDRTIDSHIKKLRRKLEAIAPETEIIYSVYGAGYKVELP